MEVPAHRDGRRLSSKNKKLRDKYTESVMIRLESQNLFKRVGELHTKALTGEFSKGDLLEYNKLDDIITQTMLVAPTLLFVLMVI